MTAQNRCKFCMQPDDKHLVGCPLYKKPEERSKIPENPFGSLFGDIFDTNNTWGKNK